MRKIILPIVTLFLISCDHDSIHEKLATYEFKLKVDSFISVFEEAARIKDVSVPIRITLAGNGNVYDNQHIIDIKDELVLTGLVDKEYTIFAFARLDGNLYYKEFTFNPVKTPSMTIELEGVVTKFRVSPVNWPEACSKLEIIVHFDHISMIDETGFYLNTLFTGGGEHKYTMTAKDDNPYYYANPFWSWGIEVIVYDDTDKEVFRKENKLKKHFERLKAYNIKIDLAGMMASSGLRFVLEDLEFEEEELNL